MSSIEQLITPQYIYSNIVEHLRSQLNVKTLLSSEIKKLEIVEVEVSAFSTKYNFLVERETTEEASSLILPTASKAETVCQTYIGYLAEILEPGAERPIFEFQASRA